MSDFLRRPAEGLLGLITGDIEDAFRKQGENISAAGNYTPADVTDWADPPPTTVSEALDRIAAAVAAGSTTI